MTCIRSVAQIVEALDVVVQRRALGAEIGGQRVDRQRVPALAIEEGQCCMTMTSRLSLEDLADGRSGRGTAAADSGSGRGVMGKL